MFTCEKLKVCYIKVNLQSEFTEKISLAFIELNEKICRKFNVNNVKFIIRNKERDGLKWKIEQTYLLFLSF